LEEEEVIVVDRIAPSTICGWMDSLMDGSSGFFFRVLEGEDDPAVRGKRRCSMD